MPAGGLTGLEARHRLERYGPNATPEPTVHPLRRIVGKFFAPVPCMLEAAIALQLYIGEYAEAGVIASLLVFNATIGLFHERKAQATIAALKSRLALAANVLRDGSWMQIPSAELVPGDVVKLSLGNVVPADMRLVEGAVLLDRSTITGESLPVEAGPGAQAFAGSLVRRGEVTAVVTATGTHTQFGRSAELVRTAYVESSRQKAIMRVVGSLAVVNGCIAIGLIAYAYFLGLPAREILPLLLVALIATVPVALPATFTLATALGAQALAKRGVLPTSLSAVDEAAIVDVLCADKTGTLTQNELAVTAIRPMPGFDDARILALAALASSEGGQDPVDRAVRTAARLDGAGFRLVSFVPFDPARKMSEATVLDASGTTMRTMKGAFATIAAFARTEEAGARAAKELEEEGFRVLGVATGVPGNMALAGLIALSDPPRADSASCIAELKRLGIRVVMISGDAATTAQVISRQIGISGKIYPPEPVREDIDPDEFDIYAGVLPEDKFRLVKAFQRAGHSVAMCGDGVNDAPALRQAQIGIAVSTATDVAKSAAAIVLTEPGLSGIVTAIEVGRTTFQRILTYTLRSFVHKSRQVLLLTAGLAMTGHAVLTPTLVVLSMILGDFLAMSSTTDNVEPSTAPNTWHISNLTIAGLAMGVVDLLFCVAVLAIGKYWSGFGIEILQTLTMVMLVFSGQAIFYVVRERRRLWSSRPSRTVILCSIVDMLVIPTMAAFGILMAPLPLNYIAGIILAAAAFAFVLDTVKVAIFKRLKMT